MQTTARIPSNHCWSEMNDVLYIFGLLQPTHKNHPLRKSSVIVYCTSQSTLRPAGFAYLSETTRTSTSSFAIQKTKRSEPREGTRGCQKPHNEAEDQEA